MMPESPAGHLSEQLLQVTLRSQPEQFHSLSYPMSVDEEEAPSSLVNDICVGPDKDKDCILSQDFFCTPDYITPEGQEIPNNFDNNKENVSCPRSPEKQRTAGSKRYRHEGLEISFLGSKLLSQDDNCEQHTDPLVNGLAKRKNYISQSVVALRSRVMPPPCIKNPYLNENLAMGFDAFSSQRIPCGGFSSPVVSGEGFSRYRTDFHEIEQIGCGTFNRVFKVLKRIDGSLYAVKHSLKQLHQDTDRRRALMEVQALAALGSHENIVGYYTSWFENEQLFIQMELCDHNLSICEPSHLPPERILTAMYQIAKALRFIHEHGIAHLDVKPENMYIRNGIFKLGDFGCATRLDGSLPIEEGDARYMPHEILNDKYDHLEKVDIFSLGAAAYELLKGSPLPKAGPYFVNLREGKIVLLPGHSVQIQNLLKAMLNPDPVRRPSAAEILQHPMFERFK